MYAVIKTGGKQHKVSEGDVIAIEKIDGDKGDAIVFDQVLMVEKEGQFHIGRPVVEGAKVTGEILALTKAAKLTVFKMKKRKGYRKKTGHRQQLTSMRIKEISI
ncbi:MAG TPA: 50S ribosomal protein L21 [Syntrophus sp. (in: bacteria)]|nr:MAG: 50S ribosomal protein L21 [Syntrophus sp. GWC2_56_31]HBB17695.1 50S ribosomal protein L21 [Syntrophus sp. (in: bacteria)]